MNNKCVVVHAGARDNYELSLALNESGSLERLVTELYCPEILKSLLTKLAAKRYKDGLPAMKTSISFEALWLSLEMSIRKNFRLNNRKDLALSRAAYKLAHKKKAHLFCYSYYAAFAFAQKRSFPGQQRLLFQLHPHPRSVRMLLDTEIRLNPDASASILYENEMQYSDHYLDRLCSEPQLADRIAVASTYTKKTLVENGIMASKIHVIPYGVDILKFPKRKTAPRNERLKIIFVGSMVQRKGLSYLLDAVNRVGSHKIDLTLCGRGFIDKKLIDQYGGSNLSVKIGLSRRELIEEMHGNDLFVLPTLSEGFAHVILEAMSLGLPVITTDHSCGSDIITHGKDGWIIPVRNTDAIVERLHWAIDNYSTLYDMGQAAALTASSFTWEKFRRGINHFYQSMNQIQ